MNYPPKNREKDENIRPRLTKESLNLLYKKLFRINDTAHKVAAGLGIGVFCGIMPGVGLIAALFLAWLLRVNRAAAILGSLATNTWLSIATFMLSVKLGSVLMGLHWQAVRNDWLRFLSEFKWLNLFNVSILKIILPLIIGYVVVSISLGLVTYLSALVILTKFRYANKSRINLSR